MDNMSKLKLCIMGMLILLCVMSTIALSIVTVKLRQAKPTNIQIFNNGIGGSGDSVYTVDGKKVTEEEFRESLKEHGIEVDLKKGEATIKIGGGE